MQLNLNQIRIKNNKKLNFTKNHIILLAFSILMMANSGCKKKPPPDCYDPTNPDCVNYDPCYGVTQPTADFVMEASTRNHNNDFVYIPDDSIFLGVFIRFRSEYRDTFKYKHKWYLGAETLTDYQVERNFDNVTRPELITISHVIRYQPDIICCPNDDGIDSVSKTFYLIKYFNELNIFGKYRGVLNNEVDSFDIEIYFLDDNMNPAEVLNFNVNAFQYFMNFHNNGDTVNILEY